MGQVQELETSLAELRNQIGKLRLVTWEQDSCRGAGEAGWNAPEEGGRWKDIVQRGRGV